MPKDSAKIRLPELPVFKKYSLALRQEFASVDEILSVLERTTTKIRDGVERADEERRRQEQAAMPDTEPQDEVLDVESALAEDPPQEDLEAAERPFWEEPWEEETSLPAGSKDPARRAKPGRSAKAKPKAKARKARPAVVRVGHHGKPLTSKKAAPKKAAPKKKTVARKPASTKGKPKSRAGSRRR